MDYWNDPPEDDEYCQCCGKDVDNCECPECPECGEQGNPECMTHHGYLPGRILHIRMLGIEVACANEDSDHIEASISRRLYKDTSCGIGFSWARDPEGFDSVSVSGYCEGTDAECESYSLTFPFQIEDFWTLVEQADKDGCDMWDETHGCEECWPEGTCDNWGNEYKPGEVGAPINKECKACEGHGVWL